MKFRQDYVTNSSSSSYIIAARTVKTDGDSVLKSYADSYTSLLAALMMCENGETRAAIGFDTKQDFERYLIENYSYYGEEHTLETVLSHSNWIRVLWEKASDLYDKGFFLFEKYIDYNDDGLSQLIKTAAMNNENFIILESD